jgi:hypothetical protein
MACNRAVAPEPSPAMHSICSQLTTKPQGHKNNPASSGHSVKVLQL